jgi:site-specific DNA-cytosine methylase
MNILVACEFSGVVREAFKSKGHYALSCDLLDTEIEGNHYRGDIRDVLYEGWDIIIAHPPCDHLAVSGAARFAEKRKDGRQQQGIDFFNLFTEIKCEKVAIENPIGIMSTLYRKPDQIIHPFQFGHMERKSTCLWLKGLPLLVETDNVYDKMMKLPKNKRERLFYLPPSPDRWKLRSTTFQGIANAMANQWG